MTVPQNKVARFLNSIEATQNKELLNSKEWNFTMKNWIVGSWNQTMENTQSWYATESARKNAALYWQTGDIDYWSEAVSEHTGEFRSDIMAWALGITGSIQSISIMNASRYKLGQSTVNSSLRSQKQLATHTNGGGNIEGKSFLNSLSDAQNVLNSVQTGEAKLLHINTS